MVPNARCTTDELLTHQLLRAQAIEQRNRARQAREDYEAFLDMAGRLIVLGLLLTAILLAIFLPYQGKGGSHAQSELAPVSVGH